jgi:hypothetical protein
MCFLWGTNWVCMYPSSVRRNSVFKGLVAYPLLFLLSFVPSYITLHFHMVLIFKEFYKCWYTLNIIRAHRLLTLATDTPKSSCTTTFVTISLYSSHSLFITRCYFSLPGNSPTFMKFECSFLLLGGILGVLIYLIGQKMLCCNYWWNLCNSHYNAVNAR